MATISAVARELFWGAARVWDLPVVSLQAQVEAQVGGLVAAGLLSRPGDDPDCADIRTRGDADAAVAATKRAMGEHAPATLYPREVVVSGGGHAGGSPQPGGVSLLQFNVLAEGLAAEIGRAPPRGPSTSAPEWGSFDAVPNPERCLAFGYVCPVHRLQEDG